MDQPMLKVWSKKQHKELQSCTQQKLLILVLPHRQFSQLSPKSFYDSVKLIHHTLQQVPKHSASLWNTAFILQVAEA